jgi:nicotinate-nucleotide adenylyltransferase
MQRRVAIFGSACDPPHFGHAVAIHLALQSGLIDEVWLMPSGARSEKSIECPVAHRLAMAKLFVAELFPSELTTPPIRVRVDETDAKNLDPQRGTADLMTELQSDHPTVQFYFLISSELLPHLPNWKRVEALKRSTKFLIVDRPGLSAKPEIPRGFSGVWLDNPEQLAFQLSSTRLRKVIAKSGVAGAMGMTAGAVLGYIKQQQLY